MYERRRRVGKGKVERDFKAASDFSPGNYVCMSAVEGLEREKLKGKRDYYAVSDFSPGCERVGDEEELERGKEKVKREKELQLNASKVHYWLDIFSKLMVPA